MVSVFCGTRDLKAALDLHEIWRNPKAAQTTKSIIDIHPQFYRQKQISQIILDDRHLQLRLGGTTARMNVTETFLLIPKILIDNAIKYSATPGTISIDFIETGNTFKIICRNEGLLIKQAERDEVFRRGYRGKNSTGIPGSGIGLWLARLIMEANGGTITFDIDEKKRDASGSSYGESRIQITLIRQFN